jgi:hypothetical protein
MRRLVTLFVLISATGIGAAGTTAAAAESRTGVHASVLRAVPASKSKKKSKTVTFTVTGTFQGKSLNGKAPSNTVRCYPSGDFFNGMWLGRVGTTQVSINFQTRTGTQPTATGANTASLIVDNNQQDGLGADNPTITLAGNQKSGTFDAQFVEAGSSANSIRIKGPFKCAA